MYLFYPLTPSASRSFVTVGARGLIAIGDRGRVRTVGPVNNTSPPKVLLTNRRWVNRSVRIGPIPEKPGLLTKTPHLIPRERKKNKGLVWRLVWSPTSNELIICPTSNTDQVQSFNNKRALALDLRCTVE